MCTNSKPRGGPAGWVKASNPSCFLRHKKATKSCHSTRGDGCAQVLRLYSRDLCTQSDTRGPFRHTLHKRLSGCAQHTQVLAGKASLCQRTRTWSCSKATSQSGAAMRLSTRVPCLFLSCLGFKHATDAAQNDRVLISQKGRKSSSSGSYALDRKPHALYLNITYIQSCFLLKCILPLKSPSPYVCTLLRSQRADAGWRRSGRR